MMDEETTNTNNNAETFENNEKIEVDIKEKTVKPKTEKIELDDDGFTIIEEKTIREEEEDIKQTILMYGIPYKEVNDKIENHAASIGGSKMFVEIVRDNLNSFEGVLIRMRDPDTETGLSQERISNIEDKNRLSQTLKNEKGHSILGMSSPPKSKTIVSGKETVLTGNDAINAFRANSKKHSIRRIPLYNSGFYIDIVTPSLSQINNFRQSSGIETQELGRILGAAFYANMDYFVKEAAVRLFKPLIVNATLVKWNEKNNLLNSIKLEDYDVILTSIANSMYPEGFPDYTYACTGPSECSHIVTKTISIKELILNDYSKLSKAAISHMQTAMRNPVTQADLVAYQKELTFFDNETTIENIQDGNTFCIPDSDVVITMKSPSYQEYLTAGASYLDDIDSSVKNLSPDELNQALYFRQMSLLSPWISSIALSSENIIAFDQPAIIGLLDDIQTNYPNESVMDMLFKAIENHKISHIAYPVGECPSCKHTPETPSGFFTVDPMTNFFTICGKKLQDAV